MPLCMFFLNIILKVIIMQTRRRIQCTFHPKRNDLILKKIYRCGEKFSYTLGFRKQNKLFRTRTSAKLLLPKKLHVEYF